MRSINNHKRQLTNRTFGISGRSERIYCSGRFVDPSTVPHLEIGENERIWFSKRTGFVRTRRGMIV